MNYSEIEIVLQEVPDEISICFTITGCEMRCKGCHSAQLWNKNNGEKLSKELYLETLSKYQNFASCVLFMGGEWYPEELIEFLSIAKKMGYKTCLYTGLSTINKTILTHLTYIKTGAWNENVGGLESAITNQQFIVVNTNEKLNHLFLKY